MPTLTPKQYLAPGLALLTILIAGIFAWQRTDTSPAGEAAATSAPGDRHQRIDTTSPLTVRFPVPMNVESVDQHVWIEPQLEGTGEFDGQTGPARTFTPIDVWDLRLKASKPLTLDLHEGRNTALVVLRGTVQVNGQERVREGQLVLFGRDGHQLSLEANSDAVVLLLSGEPIDEPVVGHGPFVMNTKAEIHEAIRDYQSGRMGEITRTARVS
jgi:hypothetical protein